MEIKILTHDNFTETIDNTHGMAIVDFYADWCMPCKMIAPVLEEIAQENKDVTIYKVNVDENPDLAMKFDIRSIPNLISFKNGAMYKRILGAQPKDNLLELVK